MKKIIAIILTSCLIWSLSGCNKNKEITLNLSYGDQTGLYDGEMNEQGLPHGYGKFTSQNEQWVYEGQFENGHFEGEGKITWNDGTAEIGTYKNDVIIPMKEDEIKSLYTKPEDFKDHYVEIIGKVFTDPEYTTDMVAFQMWTDIENFSNDIVVYIYDTNFNVEKNDYVHIIGKIGDVFEGENAFGGIVTSPTIIGKKYEILSYQDAFAPSLKTLEINETQKQYGYSITLQKIEFAEKETRFYLKIHNNGSDTFDILDFDMKISQKGKQIGIQDNYHDDYPKIQNHLFVGNSTEGIITFPTLKNEAFTLTIEAYSNNINEDIKPFQFNIKDKALQS